MKLFKGLLTATAAVVFSVSNVLASDFLVSTDWLEKNLDKNGVRILEVSVNPGVYERGHIPGAFNVRWHTDLVDPVKRDLVNQENFQSLLQSAGISNG